MSNVTGHIAQFKPTVKQYYALEKLLDHQTEYILFGGGAGSGKSYLICFYLIYMSLAYPETRYFLGREELKRLKDSTLITFFKLAGQLGLKVDNDYSYNAINSVIMFNNGSTINLLDLKYLPSDPLFERLGSTEYTSGVIDEAAEVHQLAFEVLKSRINRCNNDKYKILGKILMSCNPSRGWLYSEFYKKYENGTLEINKAFIQALIKDNNFRESGALEKLESINNEVIKQRLLYGNWNYADDPNQLIEYQYLDKLLDNKIIDGNYSLGVDVARFGNDKSVIVLMKGNQIVEFKSVSNYDTVQTAEMVYSYIKQYNINPQKVGIDTVGVGGGVADYLKNVKRIKVQEINSGISAIKEVFPNLQFRNLRSQMFWTLADDIKNGNIVLNISNEIKEQLYEDLTAFRYEIASDKLIKIESKDDMKKRLGRSPDLADALCYCNWVRVERVNKRLIVSDFTLSF